MNSFVYYPIKPWMRSVLSIFPSAKRMQWYARLCEGYDLSSTAPDELGCAESFTRLVNELFPGVMPITTGTWSVYSDMLMDPRWRALDGPKDGCAIMAVTGQGKGNGHVGVVDGTTVWSNNSQTGKWSKHLSVRAFVGYYIRKGFPIHYYELTL